MTNPTKTPKSSPNRDKTGPSALPHCAKQTQFRIPQHGDKRHNESDLEKKRPISPPPKQTQTNPIGKAILNGAQRSRMDLAGVLGPAEQISRAPRPHPISQISDLKSAAPAACPVIIRAKQTRFHQLGIERKGLCSKRLRRIASQAARVKQSQTKPIRPPHPNAAERWT